MEREGFSARRRVLVLALVFITTGWSAASALTLEQRVAAQRAIEEVYWRHRIWPVQNPGPKPPLSAALPDQAIRAKVEEQQLKEQAIVRFWNRSITPVQVQAELDRMARSTRSPQVLRELFEALGADPILVAECLVRPILVDRLIHGLQERDRPSRSFEEWWARARATLPVDVHGAGPEVDGGYSLPTIADSSCEDDTWLGVRDGRQPEGRHRHAAVWTGTEMLIWGGRKWDGGWIAGYFRDGGRYTPATDSWSPFPTGPGVPVPEGRWKHSAVWTGSEMIVWGGEGESGSLNSGGRYDPASNSWTPTSTGAGCPSARSGHTAVWTGTEMIVWGAGSNTGGRYDPSNNTWTPTSTGTDCPSSRRDHTAVWAPERGEMIVWGGGTNTGGRYNPSTDSWKSTSTGTYCPTARDSHTAVWTGSRMVVWGGLGTGPHGDLLDTGGRYNPSTDTWAPTSTDTGCPSARRYHTAVWAPERVEMIVWGGDSNSGARYNPPSNTWTPTSAGAGCPSGRHGHTAVWTGAEMIIWGGGDDLDSGGRYDPAADAWTPTFVDADIPTARIGHTGVWTGAEMIIWGGWGFPSGSEQGTGGRYTPATDSWSATSGTGAPWIRESHSAVWTGTEMIVWGGIDRQGSENFLNTGGRYNPAADSWIATSTGTNVPPGRGLHTAVWSGAEMIVWGGRIGGALDAVNTGGRYSPSTDGWTPTSTASDVPAPRYRHAAAWTGSGMLVWGGSYNDGAAHYLDTGGLYDPSADTWTVTPTTGAPAPRDSFASVWTGDELIVWGGWNGSTSFQSGARYSPSAGSWTPTSTGPDLPAARRQYTAVWSGEEMIVWGGRDAGEFDSGGRYDPGADSWVSTSLTGAPIPRAEQVAVWTGAEMIVWGGADQSGLATGGRYCALACSSTLPVGSASVAVVRDATSALISWTTLADATAYDLERGGLLLLESSGGDFTQATQPCLANDQTGTSFTNGESPGAGDGLWYLVRGVNCAGAGSYNDGGAGQQGDRDPGINVASGSCP